MKQGLKLPEREPIVSLSRTADRSVVPQAVILSPTPLAKPFFLRIWPLATIIFGLALTAAWMSLLGYLLGYALVTLIGLTI